MAAFLAIQLDFIFFFYGLAFMLLGAVSFALANARGRQSSALALGMFGILHGAGEWLALIALIVTDAPEFAAIRTAILAVSFLFLMESARKEAVQAGLKPPRRWLYLLLLLVVTAGGMAGGIHAADALARYVIALPAGIASSLGFAWQAKRLSGAARYTAVLAAVAMALYAVAAGAIVPKAPFWPADTFNYPWFVQATGVPIQLVRGSLACILAFSLWSIWAQVLSLEVASAQYSAHLRRQFIWTLAAMSLIVVSGWTLTEFMGKISQRHIQETAQGDLTLLASRLAGETAIVDGMVQALAGSRALRPLLSGGSPGAIADARQVLDLDVAASGARLGTVLDTTGAVAARFDRDGTAPPAPAQSPAPWFLESAAGKPGHQFVFDAASGRLAYDSSAPIHGEDGAVVGVAMLQKALDGFAADLKQLTRSTYLINPDGVVLLTNRPEMMTRMLWPLSAARKAALARQFGPLDDRPVLAGEAVDAAWTDFDGQHEYLRRRLVGHGQWSILTTTPRARLFASRILGIAVTLLVTIIVLIYFFGREHGVRIQVQVEKRAELQKLAAALRLQATTDRLTGLHNRTKFDEALASETARSQRYQSPLALVIYDIDRFKQINDLYGHQTGDDVLVRLSQIISGQIRGTDLLARWGGEEFVLLAPGLNGPAALKMAEKLKAAVAAAGFEAVADPITCSFGVTEYFQGDTAETMVARADHALYRAKKNGRNRAELAAWPAAAGAVA